MIGSNVHYFYYTAEHCFRSLAEAGFREMELYLGTPHVFVDGKVTREFGDLRALCGKYGIRIAALHPETLSFRYTLCHPDPVWNRRSVAAYRNAVRYAEALGVPRIHTNIAGCFRDLRREETLRQVTADLREIGETAAGAGVMIGLETESPVFQGFIRTAGELGELLSALEPLPFDVLLNYDAAKAAGESVSDWLRAFPDRLRAVRAGSPEDAEAVRRALAGYSFAGEILCYPLDDDSLEDPPATDRRFAAALRSQ